MTIFERLGQIQEAIAALVSLPARLTALEAKIDALQAGDPQALSDIKSIILNIQAKIG